VLDIGCGAGRHSLYLQKKGLDVLGIDKSPLAVKVCRLRGVKKAKVMPIEDIDFKPNSFDTIIMMGGNFGLFGSFKKARRLLKRFYGMTSDDRPIIAEAVDPYGTDNPAQLKYYDINRKRGKLSGQWRIRMRFKNFVTKWFDYLHVSKEEMKRILDSADWNVQKLIDSGTPAYVAIMKKTRSQ
jgi:SAM-dependent methyltransferase